VRIIEIPEIPSVHIVRKGDGTIRTATISWSDGANSVYYPENDSWKLEGCDGNILEADCGSVHYKACMEKTGIVPRKN